MSKKYKHCFGSDDDDDSDDTVTFRPGRQSEEVRPTNEFDLVEKEKKETVVVNRYVIKRKLGKGSFGTVYLVSDVKENNELKVIKKIPVGDTSLDESIDAVKEARLQAKLNHPGIVQFYDCFISNNSFCIITVFCEGGDLCDEITRHRRSDKVIEETCIDKWVQQLLCAVQYLHSRYIIHRDLKTRNIFLKDGSIKIGDFGISKTLSDTADLAMTFKGTPYYMSPEVLKHEGYSMKSDIWSLGVIVFELCTLKRPFEGRNIAEVMVQIASKEIPVLENTHVRFKDIITRMLSRDTKIRPTATELLQVYTKEKSESSYTNKIQRAKRFNPRNDIDNFESNRPMTPRERLIQRKQSRADEEVERLRRITVSSYEENRRLCSQAKDKQSKISNQFPWQQNTPDPTQMQQFPQNTQHDQEQPYHEDMYDDDTFESDTSSSCSPSSTYDEHNAMQEYMAAALESMPDKSYSTSINETQCTKTLRRQKIESLKRESKNLLGKNFDAVYQFLKEARFEGDVSMSEQSIMEKLKSLVERPRDCFLVDQLLFLEKQEEIIIMM